MLFDRVLSHGEYVAESGFVAELVVREMFTILL